MSIADFFECVESAGQETIATSPWQLVRPREGMPTPHEGHTTWHWFSYTEERWCLAPSRSTKGGSRPWGVSFGSDEEPNRAPALLALLNSTVARLWTSCAATQEKQEGVEHIPIAPNVWTLLPELGEILDFRQQQLTYIQECFAALFAEDTNKSSEETLEELLRLRVLEQGRLEVEHHTLLAIDEAVYRAYQMPWALEPEASIEDAKLMRSFRRHTFPILEHLEEARAIPEHISDRAESNSAVRDKTLCHLAQKQMMDLARKISRACFAWLQEQNRPVTAQELITELPQERNLRSWLEKLHMLHEATLPTDNTLHKHLEHILSERGESSFALTNVWANRIQAQMDQLANLPEEARQRIQEEHQRQREDEKRRCFLVYHFEFDEADDNERKRFGAKTWGNAKQADILYWLTVTLHEEHGPEWIEGWDGPALHTIGQLCADIEAHYKYELPELQEQAMALVSLYRAYIEARLSATNSPSNLEHINIQLHNDGSGRDWLQHSYYRSAEACWPVLLPERKEPTALHISLSDLPQPLHPTPVFWFHASHDPWLQTLFAQKLQTATLWHVCAAAMMHARLYQPPSSASQDVITTAQRPWTWSQSLVEEGYAERLCKEWERIAASFWNHITGTLTLPPSTRTDRVQTMLYLRDDLESTHLLLEYHDLPHPYRKLQLFDAHFRQHHLAEVMELQELANDERLKRIHNAEPDAWWASVASLSHAPV